MPTMGKEEERKRGRLLQSQVNNVAGFGHVDNQSSEFGCVDEGLTLPSSTTGQ